MSRAVLLLGSNVGDRWQNLANAINSIEALFGEAEGISMVYETQAWGNTQQGPFLNLALIAEVFDDPFTLLEKLLRIETNMGRIRAKQWEPRIIDIDILFFDDMLVNEEELVVPHPYLAERRFTLKPLCDLLPNFRHPLLQKTMTELLEICPDQLAVNKIEIG